MERCGWYFGTSEVVFSEHWWFLVMLSVVSLEWWIFENIVGGILERRRWSLWNVGGGFFEMLWVVFLKHC